MKQKHSCEEEKSNCRPWSQEEKVIEVESGSGSKRRKVEGVENNVTREERNEILRTQKMFTRRVFDS